MYNVVLFDIDGTLLDTTEFLYQAFEYSIRSQDLIPPTREEMSKVIGVSLEECYLAFAPVGKNALLCQIHNEFQLKNPHLSKPYPETLGVLKKLKNQGIRTVGITNRWESTGRVSVEGAGLDKFLEFVNYRDGFERIKPDPEMLVHALKKLEVSKDEVLMVGDTGIDIKAAQNTGVRSVGVTYGFLGEKILEFGPDYLIDDLAELISVIENSD